MIQILIAFFLAREAGATDEELRRAMLVAVIVLLVILGPFAVLDFLAWLPR